MNHRIFESIVTTRNEDGSVQIAPMGIWQEDSLYVLAPFRPSRTLDNIKRNREAVINFTDDVRIFAGCLSGHYDWDVVPDNGGKGFVLKAALTHVELKQQRFEDDDIRPRFYCQAVFEKQHGPFKGYNRAQSAVLELAILVSRLDRLPVEKIRSEVSYLGIAIEKTAGVKEREAWGWLMDAVNRKLDGS